jgi:hypothetical protein
MSTDDTAPRRQGVPLRGLWLLATDPDDDSPVIMGGLLTVPAEMADTMDPAVLNRHRIDLPGHDDNLPPAS